MLTTARETDEAATCSSEDNSDSEFEWESESRDVLHVRGLPSPSEVALPRSRRDQKLYLRLWHPYSHARAVASSLGLNQGLLYPLGGRRRATSQSAVHDLYLQVNGDLKKR